MEMLLGALRPVRGATMQREFNIYALWAVVSMVCVIVLIHYNKNSTYLTERGYLGNEKDHLSGTDMQVDPFWDINYEFQNAPESSRVKTVKPVHRSTTLGPCPDTPSNLVGPLWVDFHHSHTWNKVRKDVSAQLQDGGRYKPRECFSEHKVGEHVTQMKTG